MQEIVATSLVSRWQSLDKGQLVKWTVYFLLLLNRGGLPSTSSDINRSDLSVGKPEFCE